MASEKLVKVLKHVQFQAFYFTFFGGYIPFLLYFPIYLKYIGISTTQVGVLSCIRAIFQSIATPLLVKVCDSLQARKPLFIISSILAIGKLVGLFLLLRPSHQLCVIKTEKYVNNTPYSLSENSYVIYHRLSKRDLSTSQWSQFDEHWNDLIANETSDMGIQREHTPKNGTLKLDHGQHMEGARRKQENTTNHKNATAMANGTKRFHANQSGNSTQISFYIENDKDEVNRLFYGLLIVLLLTDMFDAAVFTMVDHSCKEKLAENYGITRLWGTLGWSFMASAMAVVLHTVRHEVCGRMMDSYHYIFIFAIALSNLALLVGSHLELDLEYKRPKTSKGRGASINFHYGVLLLLFAFAGFCNGFLFNYVNWFIDSLGGHAGIMGVAIGCRGVVDVGLFFLLGKILDNLGYVPTISIGLGGHIVVMYVFSLVKNAWMVVLVEIMHAFFYGFLVSTCAVFLGNSTPAGSNFHMQAILHGIYWGVGTGSGALFSGHRLSFYGFHETFLLFTWVTGVVAFMYMAIELMVFFADKSITKSDHKTDRNSSSTEPPDDVTTENDSLQSSEDDTE